MPDGNSAFRQPVRWYCMAQTHRAKPACSNPSTIWRPANRPIPPVTANSSIGVPKMTLVLEGNNDGVQLFRKVIKLNGVEKRVMDMVGLLNVVLFLPQDLTLVEGSPADRRRFMDDTLRQVDRAYLQAVDTFEKILP